MVNLTYGRSFFLQEQRIGRVGGRQEIQVDTCVVAATNVELKKTISRPTLYELMEKLGLGKSAREGKAAASAEQE